MIPNQKIEALQLATLRNLFPHAEVVGDFHSHPWPTYASLLKYKGWEWSREDQDLNEQWVEHMKERGYDPKFALILAIAKRGKRVSSRHREENTFRQRVGAVHLVVAAYRIKTDHTYANNRILLHVLSSSNESWS